MRTDLCPLKDGALKEGKGRDGILLSMVGVLKKGRTGRGLAWEHTGRERIGLTRSLLKDR